MGPARSSAVVVVMVSRPPPWLAPPCPPHPHRCGSCCRGYPATPPSPSRNALQGYRCSSPGQQHLLPPSQSPHPRPSHRSPEVREIRHPSRSTRGFSSSGFPIGGEAILASLSFSSWLLLLLARALLVMGVSSGSALNWSCLLRLRQLIRRRPLGAEACERQRQTRRVGGKGVRLQNKYVVDSGVSTVNPTYNDPLVYNRARFSSHTIVQKWCKLEEVFFCPSMCYIAILR